MIKKLKRKVIALAMTAVVLLLAFVVAGMNIINYNVVVAEADRTLELLSHNRGSFPEKMPGGPPKEPFSQELPYESRYFSVLFDQGGNVILVDTGKIAAVDSQDAVTYASRALRSGKETGFVGAYRFLRSDENGHHRVIFLDCGRKLDGFYSFLYASLSMTAVGLAVVFVVILFLSGRIVRPIAQSYEKQKRFITDAGHEIKTPLTIINANVDVLEMELGEGNECLADIQSQTRRLTALTNDLVLLSRMEEEQPRQQKIDFPVSEVVAEAVMPFRGLAQAQGKVLHSNIQPGLTLRGDARAIEQVICLLMDNALKYSPTGGEIFLNMEQTGRSILLTLSNTTAATLPKESLEHVFDRFYRGDASRNSETGGHGIGLSVVKAIVTAHGGKVRATAPEEGIFQINITLPI